MRRPWAQDEEVLRSRYGMNVFLGKIVKRIDVPCYLGTPANTTPVLCKRLKRNGKAWEKASICLALF
jgi:hypothetical protein